MPRKLINAILTAKVLGCLMLALTLAGCFASVPTSPSELAALQDHQVCRHWRDVKYDTAHPVYAELNRRGFLTDEDKALVRSGRVRIGMSHNGLYCAHGLPSRVNQSNYGRGPEYQFAYCDLNYNCRYYYSAGGRITSWN